MTTQQDFARFGEHGEVTEILPQTFRELRHAVNQKNLGRIIEILSQIGVASDYALDASETTSYQCWPQWAVGMPKITIFLWVEGESVCCREIDCATIQRDGAVLPVLETLLNYVLGHPWRSENLQTLKHNLETYTDSNYPGDALPVFGGEEVAVQGECVWSWDETHILVGSCYSELTIMGRP